MQGKPIQNIMTRMAYSEHIMKPFSAKTNFE